MSATEDAYKPFKLTGPGSKIINAYYVLTKYLMRYSHGFLLRNAVDAFVQTASDMYIEKGLNPIVFNPNKFINILNMVKIFIMYIV